MNETQGLLDILEEDNRYALEAYIFVLDALQYTRKMFKREKHVSGRELLEGIKNLALKNYGAMTKTVFEHWGIKKTIDFGNIVFNMVHKKVLSKTDEDTINDFKDVYDFNKVFVDDYTINLKNHKHKS